MDYNNPDAKPVGLDPVTYHLEEYHPNGMDGIMIVEAWLDVGIDHSENEPYIHSVLFPAERKTNALIPAAFEAALIKSMHSDKKLMDYIREACADEYDNNNATF